MQLSLLSIRRSRSAGTHFSVLTLISIACVFGLLHPLSADINEPATIQVPDSSPNYTFDDFKGIWLTEIDGRAVYLIVQRNQIARYFYRTGIDNTVYQSRWQLDPAKGLTVLEVASHQILIDPKSESIAYRSTKIDPSVDLTSMAWARSKIEPVNPATLGDWARAPDYEKPRNPYMPASYFGFWKLKSASDERSFEVRKDRMVVALIPKTQPVHASEENKAQNTSVLLGEWYKHGQQLHIAWENGAYSIVDNSNPDLVKLYDFLPGESIEDRSSAFSVLTQSLDLADREFWKEMRSSIDKKSQISLQHLAQKTLLKFYRGDWIAYDGIQSQSYGVFKFGRFGGVELRSQTTNLGTWYPSGKRCILNFEDGTRMQFNTVGSGFLIFVYEATRPLDAYPNKVLATVPLNREKLTWLKAKPSYALDLLSQWAEVQSLDSTNTHSALSDKGYPQTGNFINPNNPWWWPIWSDIQKPGSGILEKTENATNPTKLSKHNSSASLTNAGLSMASKESEPPTQSNQQESKMRAEESFIPRSDPWHWPF